MSELKDNPLGVGINNDLINGAPLYFPNYVQDNLMVSIIDPASLAKEQQNLFNKKENDNFILFKALLKSQVKTH
ncbi:hypothetical protein [Flavivirga spongiicola]|uniref:Uncharacterized protein n=1 Tax=Flavivirga spongiicola TaxID=421621 RepID=A0ABU7XMD4_9FLAO|nr:hypothetical protein [Flavivirga sp. MEBiC05379]MDO5981579.1 hypothetical protein [Flavivirga sp. MEBiC05379]